MHPIPKNPLTELRERAEKAEARASVFKGLCILLCCSVMALGILLSIVGAQHDTMVRERVSATLAPTNAPATKLVSQ